MDIIKIIGVGLIALIIIIILKQYRPEFVIYVSIIAGVIILILIMDKVSAIIDLLTSLSNKTVINNEFFSITNKNNRNSFFNGIFCQHMQGLRRNSYSKQNRYWRKSIDYINVNSNYSKFVRNNYKNITMIV